MARWPGGIQGEERSQVTMIVQQLLRSKDQMASPLTSSHGEPVHSLKWTASKTGVEIMTTSEDGEVSGCVDV